MAAGSTETPQNVDKWPMVFQFPVLGHSLQGDGSVRSCWINAKRGMWRSFWSNPGARDAGHMSLNDKAALLARTVLPQLSFRCSRWPPQKQVATELDRMQRKMAATLMKVPRYPGEPLDDFVRRRGRLAAKFCREHGSWTEFWFSRAVHWDEHLSRPRNKFCWAAKLRQYRDREWFMQRRIEMAPVDGHQSMLAGRTGTRAFRGRVHMRWHDGIAYAKH